jgi:hypothetical protein
LNRTIITGVTGVSKITPTGLYKNVSEGILKPCHAAYVPFNIKRYATTFIPGIYTFGYQTFKLAHNFPLSTALRKSCTFLLQYQENSRITI